MELRSCTQLHFIQTIEGGLVTKILNVFHGRPALKFKCLKDIYETREACHDLVPMLRPKVELEELPIDIDRAKAESPCMLAGKGAAIKSSSKTLVSSCSSVSDGGNAEFIDDDFGTMSLKQIKERCKEKKRKYSSDVGSTGKTIEICFSGKQEPSKSLLELEEYEVMEPLSSLKSRILKDRKTRRKCRKISFSSSSQSTVSIVKSEDIPCDQAIFQSSRDLHVPVDVKIEVPETMSFDCQSMTVISENCSGGCSEPLDVCEVVSSGEPGRVDCILEYGVSMLAIDDPETANDGFKTQMSSFFSDEFQCCIVNKESDEYMEHADPKAIPDADTSVRESTMMDVPSFIRDEFQCCIVNEESDEYMEPADPKAIFDVNNLGREVTRVDVPSSISDEFQCSIVNEESDEYMECADRKAILDVNTSGREVAMVDVPKAISLGFSDLSSSEIKEEEPVSDLHPSDDPTAVVSAIKDNRSITHHDSQGEEIDAAKSCGFETQVSKFFINKPQQEEPYEHVGHADPESMPQIRASGREVTVEDVAELTSDQNSDLSPPGTRKEASFIYQNHLHCTDDSIEFVPPELSNRDGSYASEDEANDDQPLVELSISSAVSEFSLFKDSNFCSSQDGCLASAATEKKQSPLSACSDEARNMSMVIKSCIDEPVTLAEAEECCHSKLQHPPERLFSARNAISPTSQKKLCKAMESGDLDDKEYYKYARKLCYRNLTENKSSRLGRANQNQRFDVSVYPEHVNRKPKNDKNGFHDKGILKAPCLSRTPPRFDAERTSIHSHSERAISFSQQQMRDIESITNKLTKELNFMKDIVKETLHSEVYPAIPLKYSAEQARIAVQKATKVEESARRWLSIMARDCNRFCKVMKLSDEASHTSVNAIQKEKRKIVFADEAGGKLCDIKTFDDDAASVEESYNHKAVIDD